MKAIENWTAEDLAELELELAMLEKDAQIRREKCEAAARESVRAFFTQVFGFERAE